MCIRDSHHIIGKLQHIPAFGKGNLLYFIADGIRLHVVYICNSGGDFKFLSGNVRQLVPHVVLEKGIKKSSCEKYGAEKYHKANFAK